MSATPSAILVFDGDCGFCTSAVQRLQRELPRMPRVVAWQRADLDALGLSQDDVDRFVWLVDERSGRRWRGAAAFAALLAGQREPLHRLTGTLLAAPIVRDIAAAGYRLIATNRHQMPGGTPACALPIGDRS